MTYKEASRDVDFCDKNNLERDCIDYIELV